MIDDLTAPTSAPRSSDAPVVLVVDDEPMLLAATRRILEDEGISTLGCRDGAEALQVLARDHSLDALISDLVMPRLGGVELLKAVRAKHLDLPVVFVTGGPSVETAIQAVELGAFRYLLKPFDANELVGTVWRAIQLSRLARAKEDALRTLGALKGIGSNPVGLETAFESALTSLWPAFQPIIAANDRRLFGYEALLRTGEPSLPHPGAVLDAAERLHQLPRLFRTMRERTCHAAQGSGTTWQLFLNLHPIDLNDPELLDPNSAVCQQASNIVLEVTERATLERVGNLRQRVNALRQAGYRIAIDDLGAGYAGLTSFASLEPEFVKLDMSLIRDLDTSSVKQRLVRLMTALCHDLGMLVVAEGIETIAERDAAVELGCDLLQGYRFGRPERGFTQPSW